MAQSSVTAVTAQSATVAAAATGPLGHDLKMPRILGKREGAAGFRNVKRNAMLSRLLTEVM